MVAARDWASTAGLSGDQALYTPCERLRKNRGWSQVRLAGLAGVAPDSVRSLEKAKVAQMQIETLMRIGEALGCSLLDLLPGAAVKLGRGGVVKHANDRRRTKHGKGKERRARVCQIMLALMQEHGGRIQAVRAVRELEPYALTRALIGQCRRDLGIESVRRPGFGNRADGWDWVLPPASPAPAEP